jgi:hypothetical protein
VDEGNRIEDVREVVHTFSRSAGNERCGRLTITVQEPTSTAYARPFLNGYMCDVAPFPVAGRAIFSRVVPPIYSNVE